MLHFPAMFVALLAASCAHCRSEPDCRAGSQPSVALGAVPVTALRHPDPVGRGRP